MKGRKIILPVLVLLGLMIFVGNVTAASVNWFTADINSAQPYISGTDCNSVGGEFTLNIQKGVSGTEVNGDDNYMISISGRDLNLFNDGESVSALSVADDGNGSVFSVTNEITPNAYGYVNVKITIPSASICMGDCDLNVGSTDGNHSVILPINVIPHGNFSEFSNDVNVSLCGTDDLETHNLTLESANGHYVQWDSIDLNKIVLDFDGNVVFTDTVNELSIEVKTDEGLATSTNLATLHWELIQSVAANQWAGDILILYTPSEVGATEQPCIGSRCYDVQANLSGVYEFTVSGFSKYRIISDPASTGGGFGGFPQAIFGAGGIADPSSANFPILVVLVLMVALLIVSRKGK